MKKILHFYLIFCFSLNLLSLKGQSYCTYVGYTDEGHYIHNFALAEIVNLHTGGQYSSPAYTNHSNQFTANLVVGKTYNMVVGAGSADISFSAWIDYDHDAAFSNAERINYTPTILANNLAVLSFSIPSTATLGNTRLRIVANYDANPINLLTPCQNSGYGEAEDYTVNILADTASNNCASAVKIAATPMCGNQNANLFVTNVASGVAYNWSNGANTSQLTVNQGGIYFISAYDSTCAVTTYDTLEVVAHPNANITAMPSALSQCIFYNIEVYVSGAAAYNVYNETDFSYHNGMGLDTFTIAPSFPSTYTLHLWGIDSFGCTSTSTFSVDFYDYYTDEMNSFNTEICEGESAALSVTSDGTLAITYQWYKDGVPIPGATSGNYLAQTEGSYNCIPNYNGECWVSNISPVYITVYDMIMPLVVTASPNTGVPYGDSVLLSCGTCVGCSYNWFDGTNYVSSDSVYYATATGNYSVEISNGNCTQVSSLIQVIIGGNSTNNAHISGLKGYPNPTHNAYNITWQNLEKVSILLYDKMGKKIYQTTAEDTQYSLNMAEYAAGIYFAKILTSDGKTASMQIVKE